jgi:hypothetical protein
MLTTTRNGPAGTFLAIFGPIHPPTRKPAASGGTSAHLTSPNNAKHTAAMAFAVPEIAFFTAFTLTNASQRRDDPEPERAGPGPARLKLKLRCL